MNAPNLARALERAIAAEPDRWNRKKLHVSDTRHALKGEGCPRQLWLRVHGRKAKDPHLGERLMFDHGRRIHERFMKLLTEGLAGSGWQVSVTEHSVVSELKASDLGLERGRLDLELVNRSGERLVVDIKTWRGIAFKYLDTPKRPHVVQLQAYMYLRDAAGGLLLYVDRDGQNATRQFPVARDDATVRRAARVVRAVAHGAEPAPLPRGPRGGTPWQCGYCSFHGASCSGPGAQLKVV